MILSWSPIDGAPMTTRPVDVLVAHPLATAALLAMPALVLVVCRAGARALDRARASWAAEQACGREVRR